MRRGFHQKPRPPNSGLTRREREVCLLIGEGLSDKEVANRLVTSTKTIEKHGENARKKLKVDSRFKIIQLVARGALALLLGFFLCASASLRLLAAEAVLNIERRGGDVILFITGGTSNVQYQVFTSPDNNVNSTNWYYWRRAYSMDFKPYGEMLVYATNTSQQARRFFQIRGVLPD